MEPGNQSAVQADAPLSRYGSGLFVRLGMTPQRAIVCALVLTGLISYVNAIVAALGLRHAGSIFFDLNDLFADFFKLVSSYPGRSPVGLEPWLPARWLQIINGYLANNPYGHDPALIQQQFSHFGMPPGAQIFYVISRHLFDVVGPFFTYICFVALAILWLMWCLAMARIEWRKKPWLVACVLLLYPSMFAFTRGNLPSYFSALAITSAFVMILKPKYSLILSALFLGFAVGFRPNNILFLPLLSVIGGQARSANDEKKAFIVNVIIVALLLIFYFSFLRVIYPAFALSRFVDSYRWISQNYDVRLDNVRFVSSPLQIAIYAVNRFFGGDAAVALSSFVRAMLIACGIGICLIGYWFCGRRVMGIPSSVLLCSVGMIIATPWFADYHLLVILVPLLCANYLEARDASGRLVWVRSGAAMLRPIDYTAILLLLVPKPFALSAVLPNAGALINPIILFTYAGVVIWSRRSWLMFRRDVAKI